MLKGQNQILFCGCICFRCIDRGGSDVYTRFLDTEKFTVERTVELIYD